MPNKGKQLRERHSSWKGESTSSDVKRNRAQRWFPIAGETCERCQQTPAIDRHHIDGDPGNNVRENISFLCRRCHMEADGRMEGFVAARGGRRGPQPPKPCIICERLYKPLRRGHCSRCYDRVLRVRPRCGSRLEEKDEG